jgi:3-phosphoshikimate 1-carboxyvinyltransferase
VTAVPLEISAPPSKSLTQRALILAALSSGESRISDPLECDDSRGLRTALRALGVPIREEEAAGPAGAIWVVDGSRPRAPSSPIFLGDGGTTLRFAAPLVLLLPAGTECVLDGGVQLRARPHRALFAALEALGVRVRPLGAPGTLPVALVAPPPSTAATRVSVETSESSQFASGLLMVGPLLPGGLTVELGPSTVSAPYLRMTLSAMRGSGARVVREGDLLSVSPGPYAPRRFAIEGDWSAAAFLLVGGFLLRREVRVRGLEADSDQGDRVIRSFLEELEGPSPLHRFDLSSCPDLIAPLAIACAYARAPSRLENVAHARAKESDRIAVLAVELSRAGLRVEAMDDGLGIEPSPPPRPARLDPRRDHRMAMAFGLLTLLEPRVEVLDPGCVGKSYPRFWGDLRLLARAADLGLAP